jgi:hypothetical protein
MSSISEECPCWIASEFDVLDCAIPVVAFTTNSKKKQRKSEGRKIKTKVCYPLKILLGRKHVVNVK